MNAAISLLKPLRRAVLAFQKEQTELVWPDGQTSCHLDIPPLEQQESLGMSREEISRIVNELDSDLPDIEIEQSIIDEYASAEWTFGLEFERMPAKPILRGFVIPTRTTPINTPVSLRLYAFITINGCKDLLDRHLHQGIHYHYALADMTHTTTMICWDTRWSPSSDNKSRVRGLFHEIHGRGSKFVRARPDRWGNEKRQSIREACEPDLRRWKITEFRCASFSSLPVWPLNSVTSLRLV